MEKFGRPSQTFHSKSLLARFLLTSYMVLLLVASSRRHTAMTEFARSPWELFLVVWSLEPPLVFRNLVSSLPSLLFITPLVKEVAVKPCVHAEEHACSHTTSRWRIPTSNAAVFNGAHPFLFHAFFHWFSAAPRHVFHMKDASRREVHVSMDVIRISNIQQPNGAHDMLEDALQITRHKTPAPPGITSPLPILHDAPQSSAAPRPILV